ncbi:pLS20_p028 family conjugation system transmembrane protein, partial [Listeria monocytogenes]
VAKAASVAGGVTGATVGITKGMEPKSTIKPDLTPPNPVNTIANENNQQPDIDNPTIRFSDDNGSGEQANSDPRTVQEENAEGPVAAENKTESTPKETKNNLSAQSKRTVVATSGNAVNTSTSKGQKRTAISPQENRNNITSSKPNTAQSDVKN